MTSEQTKLTVLEAVATASAEWRSAFNTGSAIGCANQYEQNAVMHAKPFGAFVGTQEIQTFWQKLLNDGYSDVDLSNPKIDVINSSSTILTSGWKMNKASGVIHKELWVLQADGTVKLREDDFKATS